MIKVTATNSDIDEIIFCDEYLIQIINNEHYNDILNWSELWGKKIDNIEYQLNHIENKYPLIEKSINYYIGMTESAISYINNIDFNDNNYDKKVISHVRVHDKNINDPQNLLIDYRSRDISEYLKYLFISNKYDYDIISQRLNSLNFSEFSWQLVYSRLFFPDFYFDIYDRVVIDEIEEKELCNIIERIDEYEVYLDNIYDIIYKQKKIPKINWN